MCGINGIFIYGKGNIDLERIHSMNEIIFHRGPDSDGIYLDEQIALGFQRLSIIDLETGDQPIYNEDRTCWLIFNGEIYNYRELERDLALRGHSFRTHSDAEVVIHAYEEWGKQCVQKLRGMFGFAIWDGKNRELFCARDPFGIKPFYYAHLDGVLVFSSEVKAVLASGLVTPEVDETAFLNYLTFQYAPADMTMFRHIRKLLPAHWMSINWNGMCRTERYWQLNFQPEEGKSRDYFVEGLRETLRDSVRLHLQSDVPVGTFLSSGIDSTAITSLICENRSDGVSSFGIGFADYPVNEAAIARQTAAHMNTRFYSRELNVDDFFAAVSRLIWYMDEPLADPSAIPLYHVAGLAREHVKVVLSGEGADELFGGYRIYCEPRALSLFKWLSPRTKDWIRRQASKLPVGTYGRNYLLRGTTPLSQRFVGNAFLFGEIEKPGITDLPPENLQHYRNPFAITEASYLESEEWDPVSQMQYVDIQHWLPGNILLKADKMSMAHSLELRVPFLDVKVAEFAAKIPVAYRVKGYVTKHVLREAMKGIVPPSVIHRPKLGFPVPLNAWMKGPLYEPVREILASGDLSPWIDQRAAVRLLDEHRAGKINYSRKIWALYIFAGWHQQFIQQADRLVKVKAQPEVATTGTG